MTEKRVNVSQIANRYRIKFDHNFVGAKVVEELEYGGHIVDITN